MIRQEVLVLSRDVWYLRGNFCNLSSVIESTSPFPTIYNKKNVQIYIYVSYAYSVNLIIGLRVGKGGKVENEYTLSQKILL